MTTPQSPTKGFNGLNDDDLIQSPPPHPYAESKFSHELNDKMRVPKRIRANGEFSDEDLLLSNQNGIMNSWNYSDKISMNVPDRIVVIGQNQHIGTRSAPREIVLENSILPKDPGFVRVATPPRVITLADHNFPSANELTRKMDSLENLYEDDAEYIRAQNGHVTMGFNANDDGGSVESDSERRHTTSSKKSHNLDQSLMHRDGTPPFDLSPSEEVLYLRRHLAKLNRRVLSIEIDNVQRQQREKIIYCLGLAYFLLKTIFWLNKN